MTFASIFFDFNLPNATTWFYFSLLLAVALFIRFSRLLSVRNLDVVLLFLLVPGFLLLQESQQPVTSLEGPATPVQVAQIVIGLGQAQGAPAPGISQAVLLGSSSLLPSMPPYLGWYGYLWLLCASAFLFTRCMVDLALVRRPALDPNLNLSGLAWLSAALFICLVAVAVRKPIGPPASVGKRSAAVDETQRRAEGLVKKEIAAEETGGTIAFWVETILAAVCHLAIVIGLGFMGWRHFQDLHGGVAAATLYLLLPYTAYHVDQFHHLWPAALILWAVVAYKKPTVAGALLGLAAGTGYFAVLLLPSWLSFYWRRGHGRFLMAFLLVGCFSLATVAGLLFLEGELSQSIQSALSLSDWQPWKQPNPALGQGFWTGVRWAPAYRLPVFIAFMVFALTTTFWPRPKNLAHLIALSAAVLIGIQFWFADHGGVYVLWYLPLLLLLVYRPNLADRHAQPLPAEGDWPVRLWAWLARRLGRILKLPAPLARVQ